MGGLILVLVPLEALVGRMASLVTDLALGPLVILALAALVVMSSLALGLPFAVLAFRPALTGMVLAANRAFGLVLSFAFAAKALDLVHLHRGDSSMVIDRFSSQRLEASVGHFILRDRLLDRFVVGVVLHQQVDVDPELSRQQASQGRDLQVLGQLRPGGGLVVHEEPLHPNDGIAQGGALGRSRDVQDCLEQPDRCSTARRLDICLDPSDRLVAVAVPGHRVLAQQRQQTALH